MSAPILPPVGPNMRLWGENLTRYIRRTANKLKFKGQDDSPAEDGIILWDAEGEYPTVSKGGEWRQIIMKDGEYAGAVTTSQTAASANTAYLLTYTPSISDGIDNGTPATRIVFERSGQYLISYSAEIKSSTSSTANFWFWARLNGTDIANSAIRASLNSNGASVVVSRTAITNADAGDYIESAWATSTTSGSLNAQAATAFAPATPAATIAIVRLHGG